MHVTDGKISTESMSELVVRFEIEKGDMQPPARRRWRDRFLKLGKALPPALQAYSNEARRCCLQTTARSVLSYSVLDVVFHCPCVDQS